MVTLSTEVLVLEEEEEDVLPGVMVVICLSCPLKALRVYVVIRHTSGAARECAHNKRDKQMPSGMCRRWVSLWSVMRVHAHADLLNAEIDSI